MPDDNCATCRFWRPGADGRGECRRRAPLPTLDDRKHYVAVWPVTRAADWCGEHQPKPHGQGQGEA